MSADRDTLDDLAREWVRCRGWLMAAMDRAGNTHNEADVLDLILRGRVQLWPAERSGAVTEVIEHPRLEIVRVWLAGGELRELVDRMWPAIMAWAREIGCRRIEVSGRRWHRLLGGRETYTTVVEL